MCSNEGCYKCPTGRKLEFVTYSVVDAMNGLNANNGRTGVSTGGNHVTANGHPDRQDGALDQEENGHSSPTAAERLVFIDEGAMTPDSFATYYQTGINGGIIPRFGMATARRSPGPTAMRSHLKWTAPETIEFGRTYQDYHGGTALTPQTDEGAEELRLFRKWVWGKATG